MLRNLSIRNAVTKDLEVLAKYDYQINQTPWSKSQYNASFNSNHQILILELTSSKEIIAAIVFNVIEGNSDILQLWVRQEYLKQGYGEILLRYSIEQLKSHNVSQVYLEVVERNLAAIALYNKVGFKYLNLRKNYYRIGGHPINAIVMKLDLIEIS